MCVKESMRMFAPVPNISRCTEKDILLPDGRLIPAGNYFKFPTIVKLGSGDFLVLCVTLRLIYILDKNIKHDQMNFVL